MYNNRNKPASNNNLARHSMAPHHGVLQSNHNIANVRRSSMMMQSVKISKDPRPLKDKQWIEKQIQMLIEYLCSHGYDSSMLSPKELNPPSTKNFQYICCFLFQQIDPTFVNIFNSSQSAKFEDECVSFFEKLGYPFKINKSSLRCIAPHSWPPLLGALSWIIELLQFAESFDDDADNDHERDFHDDDDSDVKMKNLSVDEAESDGASNRKGKSEDRLFFSLVANNYGLWLKGADDDEAITVKLMTVFDEKIANLSESIESFSKANAQLVKEAQRIKKECPDIGQLQDKRQTTIAALEQIRSVVQERENYINQLNAKYQSWDNKVNEKIVKINNCESKLAELKQTLSKQTISPKDVEIMNRESITLHTKRDELQLQKEETKRKQYDISERISNLSKELRGLLLEYNDLGAKIEVMPISARYSFQRDHTLKLKESLIQRGKRRCGGQDDMDDDDDDDDDEEDANIADVNNHVPITKPTDLCNQDVEEFGGVLQHLCDHFNDKIRKTESAMKAENDGIHQLKTDLEIKQKEIDILNDRLSNITTMFNEEKSKMSLLTANTARSIEKIELSMNSQSNDIESELKNKKKQFIEVSNEFNKVQEECKKTEIQITSKISIGMQKVIKHRQNVREQLKATHKRMDESLDKVSFYHIQEPTVMGINYDASNLDDDDVEMH